MRRLFIDPLAPSPLDAIAAAASTVLAAFASEETLTPSDEIGAVRTGVRGGVCLMPSTP